jgi:hypothetical protein
MGDQKEVSDFPIVENVLRKYGRTTTMNITNG